MDVVNPLFELISRTNYCSGFYKSDRCWISAATRCNFEIIQEISGYDLTSTQPHLSRSRSLKRSKFRSDGVLKRSNMMRKNNRRFERPWWKDKDWNLSSLWSPHTLNINTTVYSNSDFPHVGASASESSPFALHSSLHPSTSALDTPVISTARNDSLHSIYPSNLSNDSSHSPFNTHVANTVRNDSLHWIYPSNSSNDISHNHLDPLHILERQCFLKVQAYVTKNWQN